MNPKPWYESKTIWVNLLTVGGSAIAAIGGNEWIASNPKAVAVLGAVAGALNIALRLITGQPLK